MGRGGAWGFGDRATNLGPGSGRGGQPLVQTRLTCERLAIAFGMLFQTAHNTLSMFAISAHGQPSPPPSV